MSPRAISLINSSRRHHRRIELVIRRRRLRVLPVRLDPMSTYRAILSCRERKHVADTHQDRVSVDSGEVETFASAATPSPDIWSPCRRIIAARPTA